MPSRSRLSPAGWRQRCPARPGAHPRPPRASSAFSPPVPSPAGPGAGAARGRRRCPAAGPAPSGRPGGRGLPRPPWVLGSRSAPAGCRPRSAPGLRRKRRRGACPVPPPPGSTRRGPAAPGAAGRLRERRGEGRRVGRSPGNGGAAGGASRGSGWRLAERAPGLP